MTRHKSAVAKAAAARTQDEDPFSQQRKPTAGSKPKEPQLEELDVNTLMRELYSTAEPRDYLQLTRVLTVCVNQLDKPGLDSLSLELDREGNLKVQYLLPGNGRTLLLRDVRLAESASSEGLSVPSLAQLFLAKCWTASQSGQLLRVMTLQHWRFTAFTSVPSSPCAVVDGLSGQRWA